MGVYLTGTGTNVGKTYVTGLLIEHLRKKGYAAGYFKAALSGAEMIGGKPLAGDAKFVCEKAGIAGDPNRFVTYLYKTAVSPHLAAAIEGNPPDIDRIKQHYKALCAEFTPVVAEGSGGIMCPLRLGDGENLLLTDVIRQLGLEVIIVADAGLGTLNATVLTTAYAKQQGIAVRGIILNRYDAKNFLHRDNLDKLPLLTQVPVLAVVENNAQSIDIKTEALL